MVSISEQPGDADETPQSKHRKKIAKEESARIKKAKPVSSHYTLSGRKLILVEKTKSGNIYQTYICDNDKKNKDFIDDLKAKGKIKV